MKPVRTYCVTLDPVWGPPTDYHASARTPGGAKYQVWLEVADIFPDWTFRDFLKEMNPKISAVPPKGRYDYVRERYGLEVNVGQRVREGVVAEPRNDRSSYVYVIPDAGGAPLPFHPEDIHP
jgi:hypothetical protein